MSLQLARNVVGLFTIESMSDGFLLAEIWSSLWPIHVRKIVSNFNDPIDVVSWIIGHENNNKISLSDHESQSHAFKKRSQDSILRLTRFTFLLNINDMQAQPKIKVE